MLQECLVERCNLLAGGTVNKDAVKDVHLDDFLAHVLRVSLETCTQNRLVVVEVYGDGTA